MLYSFLLLFTLLPLFWAFVLKDRQYFKRNITFGLIGHFGLLKYVNISFFLSLQNITHIDKNREISPAVEMQLDHPRQPWRAWHMWALQNLHLMMHYKGLQPNI